MKKIVTAFLIAMFLFSSSALAARDASFDPSAGAIVADLAVIRPVSIIGTALGCGAFVVALPFTVWSKERMAKAGTALVVNPGKFAFVRPLGEDI